jgi:hypothetical protein
MQMIVACSAERLPFQNWEWASAAEQPANNYRTETLPIPSRHHTIHYYTTLRAHYQQTNSVRDSPFLIQHQSFLQSHLRSRCCCQYGVQQFR